MSFSDDRPFSSFSRKEGRNRIGCFVGSGILGVTETCNPQVKGLIGGVRTPEE